VDIDAQLPATALDAKRDRLTGCAPEGIGRQFAGQQDRDVFAYRGIPGADGRPDPAAGFGRRGRSRYQPDAARMQPGRAGRRHGVHQIPLIGRLEQPRRAALHGCSREWSEQAVKCLEPVATTQMLLQVAT
jgi:hypothetical protein